MSVRSTIVGSYPKVIEDNSDNLPRTIDQWQQQKLSDSDLEAVILKVITRVISEQEQADLDLITDGQIRWEDLTHPIVQSTEGVKRGTLRRFFDNNTYYRRLEPNGGIQWKSSWLSEQFKAASSLAKKPLKVSLPGPLSLVHATEPKAGQTLESYLPLFTEALRREVEALAAAGAKEIQLEDPYLQPDEPLLEQGLAAINQIFKGIQARRWLACYFFDVSSILEKLAGLEVDVLSLDLVTAPNLLDSLKAVGDKEVALGLVDARNTKLESKEELVQKIQRAAQSIPAEKLWLTSNCGLEFLPHEAAIKKLSLLREAAQAA